MRKTELNPQRRTRMIDAGLELFLAHGFRSTSMGEIAKRAEVAKPTLYKYFQDKEAIFVAGVERFIGETQDLCRVSFDRVGSPVDKIAGALAAKHKLFYRLVDNSSFSEELYSQSARLSKNQFDKFEQWLEVEISEILKDGEIKNPVVNAKLLVACAFGIAKKAHYVEEIGPAVRLVTQKLLE